MCCVKRSTPRLRITRPRALGSIGRCQEMRRSRSPGWLCSRSYACPPRWGCSLRLSASTQHSTVWIRGYRLLPPPSCSARPSQVMDGLVAHRLRIGTRLDGCCLSGEREALSRGASTTRPDRLRASGSRCRRSQFWSWLSPRSGASLASAGVRAPLWSWWTPWWSSWSARRGGSAASSGGTPHHLDIPR